jgi:hypothetical protein
MKVLWIKQRGQRGYPARLCSEDGRFAIAPTPAPGRRYEGWTLTDMEGRSAWFQTQIGAKLEVLRRLADQGGDR